jgi:hypothetical protein
MTSLMSLPAYGMMTSSPPRRKGFARRRLKSALPDACGGDSLPLEGRQIGRTRVVAQELGDVVDLALVRD